MSKQEDELYISIQAIRAMLWITIGLAVATAIAFGAIIMYSTDAGAGERDEIFRDAQGRTIGTASQSNGTTIFRDAQGRTTGTATNSNGIVIYRDSQGRATGTATRSRR